VKPEGGLIMDAVAEVVFRSLRLQIALLEQYAHSCVTAVIVIRNAVDSVLPDPLLHLGREVTRRNTLDEV
jgi:hypothetical protein